MGHQAYNIPLRAKAQTFAVQLAGTVYNLTWRYNSPGGCWMLTIADADRVDLARNIPVVTGRDLLDPFRHLGIAGSLIVQTDNDPDEVPTFENLGSEGRVYFVVPTE